MASIGRSAALLFALVAPLPTAAQKHPDVDLDPTCSAREYHGDPTLAVAGDVLHAIWRDQRDGWDDVYYNRSPDRGRSWLSSAVRLDTGTDVGSSYSNLPRLVASGDTVWAVWIDGREGRDLVYANGSFDGGLTWLASAIPLGGESAFRIDSLELAALGDVFCAVWWESHGLEQSGIVQARSLDGGRTWDPPGAVVTMGATIPQQLALSTGESSFHVVWPQRHSSTRRWDVYCASSRSRESSWSRRRLDVGTPSGASDSLSPHVAADGSSVYAVWSDKRNGKSDIYFTRSLDRGLTWLPEVRLDVGTAPGRRESSQPRLAVAGPDIHVLWAEAGLRIGSWDTRSNHSRDGGATWARSDAPVVRDIHAGWVSALAVQTSFLVAWHEWLDRTLDHGLTWLPAPVNYTSAPPGSVSRRPVLVAEGTQVYGLWIDDRISLSEGVRFTLIQGSQPYGRGLPGTGGLVPGLECAGQASVGGSLELQVTRGRGGAPGYLASSLSGPAEIPAFGGLLLVQPPLFMKAFVLDGPKGAAGEGNQALTLSLPADGRLLGQSLQLQAILVDPAAPQGLSLSAALETWIL